MDLILIILVILLFCGGGFGYYNRGNPTYGFGGGFGIGGILLVILAFYLLLRHGRF